MSKKAKKDINKNNAEKSAKKRAFQYNSPGVYEGENKTYVEALNDAIENNNVLNIGIIAPYGSGKSSLIKTYFDKYPDKKKKYCGVSLAYFTGADSDKDSLKRKVEKSIVEQILFKRKFSWWSKSTLSRIHGRFLSTLLFSVFLIATIALALLSIMEYTKTLPFSNGDNFYWYFGFSVFSGLATLFLVLLSVKIRKIAVHNIEVEIERDPKASILNLFVDEIINFCSETSTQYFVFEDIDRFDRNDLFLDLREINKIINENQSMTNKITFIYCVKEGLFDSAEDRSKFFDFIISIVPIFNPNNAREFVTKAINENNDESLKIDESLVIEACTYIKEKRVLNNIVNDYIVYHDKLEIESKDNNKLFAMMVYKNLNEKDFSYLQGNSGDLYNVFHSFKEKAISNAAKSIAEEILKCEEKLKDSFNEDTEESLKMLKQRITGIIAEYGASILSLSHLKGKLDNNKTIKKYEQDIDILYIDRVFATNYYGNTSNYIYMSISSIKPYLNNKTPYEIQEEILNNNKTKYNNELIELQKMQNQYAGMSVSELITNGYFDSKDLGKIQENKFLYFAIVNEHIDEGYFKFSGKQDTEFDMQYIDKVLTNVGVDPEEKIQNPNLVVSILPMNRFMTKSVLNYSITDCVLDNKKEHKAKKDVFVKYLSGNKETLEFIIGYLLNGERKSELIYELKKENYSTLVEDARNRFEVDDLEITNLVKEIIAVEKNNSGTIDFYNQDKAISITLNECNAPIEKYLNVFNNPSDFLSLLSKIDTIKFEHLDDIGLAHDPEVIKTFALLVEHSMFEINSWNVELIARFYFNQVAPNASIFLKSDVEEICDYFSTNVDRLINSLISKDTKFTDDNDVVFEILQNNNLNEELRANYLLHLENKVEFIDGLSDVLYKTMLLNNILKPTFLSISKLLGNKEIDSSLIVNYIKENQNLFTDKPSNDVFVNAANLEGLDEVTFKNLCAYYDEKIDINDIKDDSKRKTAINCGLIDLDSNSLKSCKGMNESIVACLNNKKELVDDLPSVLSNGNDYISLLNFQELNSAAKARILFKYPDKVLPSIGNDNIQEIQNIVLSNPDLAYDYRLLSMLLKNATDTKTHNKLIEMCEQILNDKQLVYIVKENDKELFEKLTQDKTKITIELATIDSNEYFKILEKKQLVRRTNPRKTHCNVYVDKLNSILDTDD